jgi:hypothetical protein
MKRKVIITKLPKAQSGLEAKQGLNSRVAPWFSSGSMSAPSISVNKTIKAVPRDQANIEAEKGEVAMLPTKSGIPDTYRIGGQRHHSGGTPLAVPPKTFIYSDTKDMRIKDKEMLEQFGMGGDGPYTPADIAKKYDVNKFKKILLDPDTDKIMRDTAEKMIVNYNLKLGKLALLQESMKGFPQGVPEVAVAYMESMKINPAEFIQGPEAGEDAQEPQARYGGNIMKYGGRDDSNKRVIVNLPKTKRVMINLPKADGGIEVGEDPLMKIFNGDAKLLANYKEIERNFRDNPKVRSEFIAKTRAAMANKENYKGKSGKYATQFSADEIKNFTDQQLVDSFLDMQKRNLALLAHDKNNSVKYGDANDAGSNTNKILTKRFNEIGVPLPNDAVTARIQQATYIGYNDLIKNKDSYEDPELKGALQNFKIAAGGPEEETIDVSGGSRSKTVSSIDNAYTDNTSRQIAGWDPPKEKPADPETPAADVVDPADPEAPYTPAKADNFQQPDIDFGAPWWLQDVIKTGHAAGNLMRIKKYAPWQAKANVVTPDVTFYDPTRELAANAEQSNIAAQNLAQFTGPQAFNARFSETQGNAARNAADILGRYNNLNVGVSNQQSAANANIMNQAGQNAANAATSLWDKYQIMNQQFDNSKSQARDALVNQYTNAITNKEYTANLNQINPQYAVDPSMGGRMYFRNPRDLNPNYTKDKEFRDIYDDLLTHPSLKNNPDKAADVALKLMGKYGTDNSFDAYTQQKKGIDPSYVPNTYPG